MNRKNQKQWEKENISSLDALRESDYQESYIDDSNRNISLNQSIISLIYILKNKIRRDYNKNFKVEANLEIFMLRNGLVDGEVKDYDYIADIYNITDERARQINERIFDIATIFINNLKNNMKISGKLTVDEIIDILCSYVLENDIMINDDKYQNSINGIVKKLK